MEIEMDLPVGDSKGIIESIEIKGKPVWFKKGEDGISWRAGIEFEHIKSPVLELLKDFLTRKRVEGRS